MSYFAKVVNGAVVNVIVAEPEFFETFVDSSPGKWVQVEIEPPKGKEAESRNIAGVGYSFDDLTGFFMSPQPFPSWSLNRENYTWEPPVPKPSSGDFMWNENAGSWEEF